MKLEWIMTLAYKIYDSVKKKIMNFFKTFSLDNLFYCFLTPLLYVVVFGIWLFLDVMMMLGNIHINIPLHSINCFFLGEEKFFEETEWDARTFLKNDPTELVVEFTSHKLNEYRRWEDLDRKLSYYYDCQNLLYLNNTYISVCTHNFHPATQLPLCFRSFTGSHGFPFLMFNYTSDYWIPIDYDNAYSFKLNYEYVNSWKIENFSHDNCPDISNLIIQFMVNCATSIIYSMWGMAEATLNYDCIENFYWFLENELIKIPAEERLSRFNKVSSSLYPQESFDKFSSKFSEDEKKKLNTYWNLSEKDFNDLRERQFYITVFWIASVSLKTSTFLVVLYYILNDFL